MHSPPTCHRSPSHKRISSSTPHKGCLPADRSCNSTVNARLFDKVAGCAGVCLFRGLAGCSASFAVLALAHPGWAGPAACSLSSGRRWRHGRRCSTSSRPCTCPTRAAARSYSAGREGLRCRRRHHVQGAAALSTEGGGGSGAPGVGAAAVGAASGSGAGADMATASGAGAAADDGAGRRG